MNCVGYSNLWCSFNGYFTQNKCQMLFFLFLIDVFFFAVICFVRFSFSSLAIAMIPMFAFGLIFFSPSIFFIYWLLLQRFKFYCFFFLFRVLCVHVVQEVRACPERLSALISVVLITVIVKRRFFGCFFKFYFCLLFVAPFFFLYVF